MKTKDAVWWLLVAAIIALLVYLAWFVNTESYKCMNEPLVYGVGKLDAYDQYGKTGEAFCICQNTLNSAKFIVTKDNMSQFDDYG